MNNKNNSTKKSTTTSQKKENPNHKGEMTAPRKVYIRKFVEEFERTDSGNADYLVSRYGNYLRYDHTNRRWLIWNGQYWEPDLKNKIIKIAQKAARKRQREVLNIEDFELKKLHSSHALKVENLHYINNCIKLAKSYGRIATVSKEWDKHSHLIQFTNGIYDLKKLEFYPGRPELMISQCVGYDFEESATSPRWIKFIDEIFDGNANLKNFVQKAIGYTITGETKEQCFFILEGSGSNGKSVFLSIGRKLLGDYAYDAPFTTFEKKYGNTQSNDIARLHSVRLVTSSENDMDKVFDEGRLKAITGEDSVTARLLYKEATTYQPQFKLWLAVNNLPNVADNTNGYWRRVKVILFRAQFEGKSVDKDLTATLNTEIRGIMKWAIEGFKLYQKEGLEPPTEVMQATQQYHHQNDIVAEWLDDTIEKKSNSSLGATDLYNEFLKWQESEYPHEKIKQNPFGKRVRSYLDIKSGKRSGKIKYLGISYKIIHETDEIVNIITKRK